MPPRHFFCIGATSFFAKIVDTMQSMKLKIIRGTLVYRVGQILPIVPIAQGNEWIRQGIAEEVTEIEESTLEPVGVERAEMPRKKKHRGHRDATNS